MRIAGFKMIWTIPNILTFLRILLIPILVIVFYMPINEHYALASAIFIIAAATDWLDGYIARYTERISKLGAFLDPVADKLMVCAALVILVQSYPYFWMALAAIVIICREIVVSALREWMAELGARSIVKVSNIGKYKTAAQMISITLLLFQPEMSWNMLMILGMILLYIAVILTLYSMYLYLYAAYKSFLSA